MLRRKGYPLIEDMIQSAAAATGEDRQRILRNLANRPDETLPVIVAGRFGKIGTVAAVQVMRLIGYPANASAVPWLVEQIDRNSPAWAEVVQAIRDLGPDITAPHIIRRLLVPEPPQEYWADDVESLCELLVILGRDFATSCGCAIACLLSKPFDPNMLDPMFLIDTLATIGPNVATCALPALADLIQRSANTEAAEAAWRLVSSFDEFSLRPYVVTFAWLKRARG